MRRELLVAWCVMAAGVFSPREARAETDPKFAEMRDRADRFDGSLPAFLERFVGDCTDPLESKNCRQTAEDFRKRVKGRKFYFIVNEEQVSNLTPGPYNPSRREFTVNLTPFFPAGGYALTQGAPKKTDANGNPVFAYVPIKVKLPDDMEAQRMARAITNHEIRVQLVFTPQDAWAIPKRGGGKLEGVKAQLDGVVLSLAATGQTLGAYYSR